MAYEVPFAQPQINNLLNPLDVQQKQLSLANVQMEQQKEKQQLAQQKALQDIFRDPSLSTEDKIAKAMSVDYKTGLALQQQQQEKKFKQAQIGKDVAASKEQEALAAQHQQEAQDLRRKNFTEAAGEMARVGQSIQSQYESDLKSGILPEKAQQNALEALKREKESLAGRYSGNQDVSAILQKINTDRFNPQEFSAGVKQFGALAGQLQRKPAESSIGKVRDDEDAGRITHQEAEKEIAKLTAPTATQIQISQPSPPAAEGLEGEAYLKKLPEAERSLVKGIAEGRVNPTTLSTKGGHRERIMEEVTHYDPTYTQSRPAVWKDFTSGKAANNITAINTAIGHIGTLDNLTDALNNKDVKQVNRFVNMVKEQTGNPSVNNFETARDAVGNELMRVFRQVGASENETKEWASRFDAAKSPTQIKGAIKTATELLHSRIDALNDQWKRGTGFEQDFPGMISPKAKGVLDKVEGSSKPVGAYDDPEKEKRYQEWKKAHGG